MCVCELSMRRRYGGRFFFQLMDRLLHGDDLGMIALRYLFIFGLLVSSSLSTALYIYIYILYSCLI